MPYIFISDGGPDAEDYDNNYFHYHDQGEEVLPRIHQIMREHDTTAPEVRREIRALCEKSFNDYEESSRATAHFKWLAAVLNMCRTRVFRQQPAG